MSISNDARELRETEAKAQEAWAEAMDDAWRDSEERSNDGGMLDAVGRRVRGMGSRMLRRGRREGSAEGSEADTAVAGAALDRATRRELEATARSLGIKHVKRLSQAELARQIARRF